MHGFFMLAIRLIISCFAFSGCDLIFSQQVIERSCSEDGHLCVQTKSEETGRVRKIWGNAVVGYWAVGEGISGVGGAVLRWGGHSWIKQNIPITENRLYDLWGIDGNHIWAVGERATILFWDGATWTTQNVQDAAREDPLWSIYGISDQNLLAVGDNGLLLRWNGAEWTVEGPGISLANPSWRSVWATPNGEYFVAGDNGYVIHQTPAFKWSDESIKPTDAKNRINSIFGLDSGSAWLAGNNGLLMERSGNTWQGPQYMDKGVPPNLNAIWTDGTGNIWTVGDVGDPNTCPAVYRLVGGQLVRHEEDYDRKSCSDARRTYRTVWGITGQEVWVGGTADGTIQRRRVAP